VHLCTIIGSSLVTFDCGHRIPKARLATIGVLAGSLCRSGLKLALRPTTGRCEVSTILWFAQAMKALFCRRVYAPVAFGGLKHRPKDQARLRTRGLGGYGVTLLALRNNLLNALLEGRCYRHSATTDDYPSTYGRGSIIYDPPVLMVGPFSFFKNARARSSSGPEDCRTDRSTK
jgi:hypothetical protein